VRNSRVLRESLAVFSLALCCGVFVELLTLPAFGADALSYTPPPFACEVRYHFREQFNNAKPGQKRFSAPSYDREPLPMSRMAVSDGLALRIVEGSVAQLPYQFSVNISRSSDSKAGTLEVNVLDSSGKSLAGFPQVMTNPLTKAGDTSRKEFEIPIDQTLKKKIEKALLAKDQFLTHVDLIIGMDDDFLSAISRNDRVSNIQPFLTVFRARWARRRFVVTPTSPREIACLVHLLPVRDFSLLPYEKSSRRRQEPGLRLAGTRLEIFRRLRPNRV